MILKQNLRQEDLEDIDNPTSVGLYHVGLRGRLDLRAPTRRSILKIVVEDDEVVRLLVVVYEAIMFS